MEVLMESATTTYGPASVLRTAMPLGKLNRADVPCASTSPGVAVPAMVDTKPVMSSVGPTADMIDPCVMSVAVRVQTPDVSTVKAVNPAPPFTASSPPPPTDPLLQVSTMSSPEAACPAPMEFPNMSSMVTTGCGETGTPLGSCSGGAAVKAS